MSKAKFGKNYAFKNSISRVNAGKKFHILTETISLFVLDTFINGKLEQDINGYARILPLGAAVIGIVG
jgi:hypothetical protein